jgi:hypothetical protein
MAKAISIFLLLVLSEASLSQNNPEKIIELFFSTFPKNSNQAIDSLYSTNPWSKNLSQGIKAVKEEINSYTIEYVGMYYGHELLVKKQLSQCFILYSYLIKYDRQPMRFTFEFYKPNDIWRLFKFKIDSDIDDEIEQSSKLYYQNLEN